MRRYGNRRCRRCDTKVELNWLLAGAPEQRKPIAAKGLFSFRNSTYESKHGERARLNETDRTRKIYDFNVFYVSVCVCFFRTSALWFIWFFFSFVYIACSDCMAMCAPSTFSLILLFADAVRCAMAMVLWPLLP